MAICELLWQIRIPKSSSHRVSLHPLTCRCPCIALHRDHRKRRPRLWASKTTDRIPARPAGTQPSARAAGARAGPTTERRPSKGYRHSSPSSTGPSSDLEQRQREVPQVAETWGLALNPKLAPGCQEGEKPPMLCMFRKLAERPGGIKISHISSAQSPSPDEESWLHPQNVWSQWWTGPN